MVAAWPRTGGWEEARWLDPMYCGGGAEETWGGREVEALGEMARLPVWATAEGHLSTTGNLRAIRGSVAGLKMGRTTETWVASSH